jgi:hypothetical protein
MATKNLRGKSIKVDWSGKSHRQNAYEVYEAPGWKWYVLKHYQTEEAETTNPYARVFCDVTSPFVGNSGELGDTYLSDIQSTGRLVAFRGVTDGVLDAEQTLIGLAPDGIRGDKFN